MLGPEYYGLEEGYTHTDERPCEECSFQGGCTSSVWNFATLTKERLEAAADSKKTLNSEKQPRWDF